MDNGLLGSWLASRLGLPLPEGVALLHPRGDRRARPAERGPHRRGAGRGGVASPGPCARLRRRERVHQGGLDHPVLHWHRGQDGVEEELIFEYIGLIE